LKSCRREYVQSVVGASLLAGAAVVVAVVAILAAIGRLRRNAIAGIRIPSLYASDAAWRIGHRAAVLPTAGTALICIALAGAVAADPRFAVAGTAVETAVLVVGVLVGTALAGRAARRLDHRA
jgi:MFS-type transporter involved in bile tolerance (Atg22 family)